MIQKSAFEKLLEGKSFSKESAIKKESPDVHFVHARCASVDRTKAFNKTYSVHSYAKKQGNVSKRIALYNSEAVTKEKGKRKTSIFISYSSKDKTYATLMRNALLRHDLKVYIDYLDTELNPKNVNKETAKELKKRIQQCKGILYIHSQKSELSKWCPWELGFGEGIKSRICVLEVIEDNTYQQEYLKMYPSLDIKDNNYDDNIEFRVLDREDEKKSIDLVSYLNGHNPS